MFCASMKDKRFLKVSKYSIFLSFILCSMMFCFPIGRKIIFYQLDNATDGHEYLNSTVFTNCRIESHLIKLKPNELYYENNFERRCIFNCLKDSIEITIPNIETSPCNFKENKESEIETITPNICSIDASAIKFLEGFLSSYHLLQENITLKYFFKLLYLFEARNIRFDQKFVKIIEILVLSLLKTGKSDADNFQEEMVNGFRIDLLSEECSFFVFKILFEFLFPSLKIKDIDRFSSSTYMHIRH
ncbi:hypothetical protein CWI38_0293p0040 [Hamiltosporidium tvaerminnensis]|uniref:Uncharacterized protein n=1 Tax=Hamiltosporidium tvaerminnensis TaxID=1176355 RepID=A0A4Q9M152_9MICR|nr:hypothetical protein CWI38_0293p0040 [Hamiltosporidium tvaerminnensis]